LSSAYAVPLRGPVPVPGLFGPLLRIYVTPP
jgi:hypothetical protein